MSALQERILRELAGMQPAWILFGAGALVGFYLGHRTTRDLDLAFRPRLELGEIPREVEARLRRVGLDVEHVQTAVSFVRFRVHGDGESVELDLVADPTAPVEPPVELRPGMLVDTPRDLFAQKLCALLSRTELRDLEDIGALLDAGADLSRGFDDAATRDRGFSPPTLAWLLQQFPLQRAAEEGRDGTRLATVRDRLLAALKS
ncbi:MAG: nucleotidyl transferase AbiEii/AbiGii toxin family protein [Myxococcota bacterium]|nr:nucleotidyl transferase AbiEii/AbiGii toxin family protein [Myxococcota bacterium]